MSAAPTEARTNDAVVNTIKTLAMDAVQRANSGHPGMPMGMADAASVLWCSFLTIDPQALDFFDRDRFVLSAGHGSMLLYALLHLSGHDAVSLEEIKSFRQLHSKTPGHPEAHITPGVETTTGPLGQGVGNAVGMAMAEAWLAARFNRDGHDVVDHFTYCICGDGDLQEGISQEAASLAGHLGLGKLVMLYDDNGITIEGKTDLSFTEDVSARFESYGWHTLKVDGHDRDAVFNAIAEAKRETSRPTIISCRTHIGHGSPNKQGSSKSHGSPLGDDEIRLTKAGLGWPEDAVFEVPDAARAGFDGLRERGKSKREAWTARVASYAAAHPELAAEFQRVVAGDLVPSDVADALRDVTADGPLATRACSGKVLNALAAAVPALWGGSADLAGSNKTMIAGAESFQRTNFAGRNLHYGIREHAMASIMNGMTLHGGVIPYGGTFLCFSDYMRGAMRLSSLMQTRVIYVLTHDSIFLGEDGPTHQSVEHTMALRLIPNMTVWRPADLRETAAAWLASLAHETGPSCLVLTRQKLPQLDGTREAATGLARGGYTLAGSDDDPGLILIGTGSELHLCTEAADILRRDGHRVRVVSMPSLERFRAQDATYRESVLPRAVAARVSVEAGRTWGWEGVVGSLGASIGVDRFGESAPAKELAEVFGINTGNVVAVARQTLAAVAGA